MMASIGQEDAMLTFPPGHSTQQVVRLLVNEVGGVLLSSKEIRAVEGIV